MKTKYKDIFDPIPHLDDLPTNVYCRIQLKDASKTFATHSYMTLHKYKEAWSTLIQQHLDAGRIRPLNSAHTSPAFLVPKSDCMVLPHWVNDYRILNANTVTNSHPLPRIDDILANCGKGKIWSKLDMTNLFFQMRVHPDDVHLMAMTTLLGLYKWLTMPMGLCNSPAIHQRHVTAALREYIGKFCHIYLDDIVIWSQDVIEHTKHIDLIMKALQKVRLYCNLKKCHFYLLEIDFLGHHISKWDIEPNSTKVKCIMKWPIPKSVTDVCAFLGLVQYISFYLLKLANHTVILTPLTTKEAKKHFPPWTENYQAAFKSIKSLVLSTECLTTVDHKNPGDNKHFVTCNTSNWRTGAVLSFGPTWESVHPVTFNSMQLKALKRTTQFMKKNY